MICLKLTVSLMINCGWLENQVANHNFHSNFAIMGVINSIPLQIDAFINQTWFGHIWLPVLAMLYQQISMVQHILGLTKMYFCSYAFAIKVIYDIKFFFHYLKVVFWKLFSFAFSPFSEKQQYEQYYNSQPTV